MRGFVLKCMWIRLRIFVISGGLFYWIQHESLPEKSLLFLPVGFLCILGMLYALIPVPHDRERNRWAKNNS